MAGAQTAAPHALRTFPPRSPRVPALLDQFPYANCPVVPPELVLLPRWAYVNLYAMSSWTRTIVVPLSIFSADKPVRRLPETVGIRFGAQSS